MNTIDPRDLCPDSAPIIPVPRLTVGQREQLIRVFRALGDATRLEVFELIAAQTAPLCVCDVVSQFQVSQPTISHHLKVLREAGLVTVIRRGTWAYYEASASELRLVRTLLDGMTPGLLVGAGA